MKEGQGHCRGASLKRDETFTLTLTRWNEAKFRQPSTFFPLLILLSWRGMKKERFTYSGSLFWIRGVFIKYWTQFRLSIQQKCVLEDFVGTRDNWTKWVETAKLFDLPVAWSRNAAAVNSSHPSFANGQSEMDFIGRWTTMTTTMTPRQILEKVN